MSDVCEHCSAPLERRFFDDGQRFESRHCFVNGTLRRRYSPARIPEFKSHRPASQLTPAPTVLCPRCDAPDPGLDVDTLGELLKHDWGEMLREPVDQLESN